MQQLRWRRSGFRSFFWSLHVFHHYLRVLHPLSLATLFIPPLITLIRPVTYIFILFIPGSVTNKIMALLFSYLIYAFVSMLFNAYARKHNPEQTINPLLAGLICFWFIADMALTLLALATFDTGEWGTRGAPELQES